MTVITGYLYAQRHTAVVTDTGVNNIMSMFPHNQTLKYNGIDNYIPLNLKILTQRVTMTDCHCKYYYYG